jgi:hypothetical protein
MKDRYNILSEKIKKMEVEKDSIKASVMSLMACNNVLQTSNGEQVAKLVESESERIKALSKIKKENETVYKYLIENGMIEKSKSERFYF